ncbi:hypothetical protein ACHAWF_001879 [Thalassiosira exigua]
MAKLTAGAFLLVAHSASAASENVTTVTLGQDIDYPPYAFQSDDGELAGFGKDVADGMTALCDDLEIIVVKEDWVNCWSSEGGGALGASVANGTIDGCMTYTHTQGVRDELAEFSDALLQDNRAAGLLTLLDEDGKTKVTGLDDLSGKTIIDVGGWAPTADGLTFVTNQCTGEKYAQDYTLVVADGDVANDVAMRMLRDGKGDAIFIYANHAHEYQKCPEGAAWNCTLWEGFGTEYAYIQTGQYAYAVNGTTLALSPKGSGIREKLRPCMRKFMATKEYYDICVKYDLEKLCYPNGYFPADAPAKAAYDLPTKEHEGDCSTGYCPCDDEGAEVESETSTGQAIIADASAAASAVLTLIFSQVVMF